MTASSFVIVADRGSLRAYRVDETAARGPSLKLVQAFDNTDASKRPGRHHPASTTDWPQLEIETNRRIYKQLADQIARVVESDGVDGWSFAAPASVYRAIVDLLPAEIRERIVEHVKSDLVKIEAAELSKHFRSLQPI